MYRFYPNVTLNFKGYRDAVGAGIVSVFRYANEHAIIIKTRISANDRTYSNFGRYVAIDCT